MDTTPLLVFFVIIALDVSPFYLYERSTLHPVCQLNPSTSRLPLTHLKRVNHHFPTPNESTCREDVTGTMHHYDTRRPATVTQNPRPRELLHNNGRGRGKASVEGIREEKEDFSGGENVKSSHNKYPLFFNHDYSSS